MNPVGSHLTNLVLHMANTVVFYAIAVRLPAPALPRMGNGIGLKLGGAVAPSPLEPLAAHTSLRRLPPMLCLEDLTDTL
jgi:hypothetical protein